MDEDRKLETAIGVKRTGLVNPHNTWEMKIITPAGQVRGGNVLKLKETIDRHLKDASWRVDPAIVPTPMKKTWKDIEFGKYQRAIPFVQRYLRSRDPKAKEAAEKLDAVIQEELNALYTAGEEAEKDGRKWEAHQKFERVAADFKGAPKAKEATAHVRRLAKDPELKDELTSMRALVKVKAQLASRNRQQRRAAMGLLEQIVERYPDTEAGRTAAELLKPEEDAPK